MPTLFPANPTVGQRFSAQGQTWVWGGTAEGWSNVTRTQLVTVSATAPASPEQNDLWIDTGNRNQLRFRDGSQWTVVSQNAQTVSPGTIFVSPTGSRTATFSGDAPANSSQSDASTHFGSLHAAVSWLRSRTLLGNVTVNVLPGTYNGDSSTAIVWDHPQANLVLFQFPSAGPSFPAAPAGVPNQSQCQTTHSAFVSSLDSATTCTFRYAPHATTRYPVFLIQSAFRCSGTFVVCATTSPAWTPSTNINGIEMGPRGSLMQVGSASLYIVGCSEGLLVNSGTVSMGNYWSFVNSRSLVVAGLGECNLTGDFYAAWCRSALEMYYSGVLWANNITLHGCIEIACYMVGNCTLTGNNLDFRWSGNFSEINIFAGCNIVCSNLTAIATFKSAGVGTVRLDSMSTLRVWANLYVRNSANSTSLVDISNQSAIIVNTVDIVNSVGGQFSLAARAASTISIAATGTGILAGGIFADNGSIISNAFNTPGAKTYSPAAGVEGNNGAWIS